MGAKKVIAPRSLTVQSTMSSIMTENMQCAICQDTLKEPVTALCGAHNFCKDCLGAHITAVQNSGGGGYGYGGYYGVPTPTCPTCRIPIQTSVAHLHVNVTLRDMIASASASASAAVSAAPLIQKQAPPPIQIKANRIAGTNQIHVELLAPAGITDTTMATLFIPVIDNSGSMGNPSVDSTQASSDAAAFSRSDLVRHAVATQIELLRPEDQMALVLFDNNATIALPATPMTDAGRAAARAQLPKIGPNGGTSIWSGLQKALTIAGKPENAGKNIVIILQTDGESDASLNPPRGIPNTFQSWKDAHPEVKVTLHTIGYGFGQALDMALLRRLAEIGNGTANYVPDGSMVGTVFTHMLANLMTCQYRGVKLHIPMTGESSDVCIPVGYLQADTPRNFVIDGSDAGEITVTADNVTTVFTAPAVGEVTEAAAAWPLAHARICKELRAALGTGARYNLAPLITAIQHLEALSQDARLVAVLKDLTAPGKYEGQFGKAFASADAFTRWGQHYMSGIVCGLENEWPINFKDATSATFGAPSGMTRRLIDRGDEIFNSLPPPKASCAPSSYGGGYGGYGGASTYVAPASMASVNNAHGGCFLGASRVLMADGTEKRCDEIQPGDIDSGGYVIAKVIKMHVPYADIVRLAGPLRPANAPAPQGGFTPWHPVFPSDTYKRPGPTELGWVHPADIGQIVRVHTDAVYNFVLEYASAADREPGDNRPGILIVDGLMACTLGHDMHGPVISHSYFGQKEAGKRNILEDLQELPDWSSGKVVIRNGSFHSDPVTGIICRLTVT
jgi:Mg-chelatase subunit ChlD